jgi:tetratricopeptide (TPR) repeat protein
MDDAMEDPARDHDLISTQAEEERLRAAAIAALTPLAPHDAAVPVMLARLRGDDAVARRDWPAADAAYRQVLAASPNDVDALQGDAEAASHLGDDARELFLLKRITEAAPSSAAFVRLALKEAAGGAVAASEADFSRAQKLARMPRVVARTNMYFGRMEAKAGRRPQAHAAFARALAAAMRIPPNDPRATWYIEQAQEGMIALGVLPGAAPSVSLAPWTGPDLPGSSTSTIKYRLAVTGAAGSSLTLAVRGLPAHWIGSFCTDRVCAPFRTTVVMPPDGVKIVEFQVIPAGRAAQTVRVEVDASLGARRVATAGAKVEG